MNSDQKELIDSCNILIQKAISELKFNSYETGKVIANLGSNLYTVQINGQNYEIKSEGKVYNVNDIVTVTIPNNNFSKKYIRSGYTSPPTVPIGWEKINEVVLTSNTATVSFSNISSDFKTFRILFQGNSTAASYSNLFFRINNLSSGYTSYNYVLNATTNNTTTSTSFALYCAVNASTQSFAEITLMNSNNRCLFHSIATGNDIPMVSTGNNSQNITSINTISLYLPSGTPTLYFLAGSKFVLLGLK